MNVTAELGDLLPDVRRVLDELEGTRPAGCRTVGGECTPTLDLYETPEHYEVVVDLPGVRADAVRVFLKRGTLVVAGEKLPSDSCGPASTFHRAERAFGRFARAARLAGAIDPSRARASLVSGELRVVVPKIAERRGVEIRISIE